MSKVLLGTPIPEQYLGDGLYVSFDGFQVRLRAPRASGDDFVFLEPLVWQALCAYIKSIPNSGGFSDV